MKKLKSLRGELRKASVQTAILLLAICPLAVQAQPTVIIDSTEPGFRTVIAGQEYKRGSFHQFLWGKHYRKEWTTPVKVPVVDLSTYAGGLTPIEQGGGRQTKTLRLVDKKGKQYVLRSIDKDYGKALPEVARGTFFESLEKDKVSTGHPFASITVPPMIEAAGVYHTNPRIFFVPYTPILDSFNKDFANTLCLIEERPDDNQEDAPHFGYSSKLRSTEKMYEKIRDDNEKRVDQNAFVRARLFDMFLGDWGRHDDQWRWAEFDSAGFTIYRPVPRDRDQAYTKFDGFLIKKIIGNESLEHLQTFSHKIRNVKKYNFPARYIDRQLTNEVSRQTWKDIAKELQNDLNDNVIESAIGQMPPEIFAISGRDIIEKLKSRRSHLVEYADKYYRFLSKEVEVVGSHKDELFEVKRLSNKETQVNLYDLDKQRKPRTQPFYSRIFYSGETHEIRLFGLKGNDIYHIEGPESNNIRVRIIGGYERDSLINESTAKGISYYDNPDNSITGSVKQHISSDTAINRYNYTGFKYNSGNTIKTPNYTNTRGVFIEAGYQYTRQKWRKDPFQWYQKLSVNFSVFNNSFGADYRAIFNKIFGMWSLHIDGRFDQKLKNYYFGLGNETSKNEVIEYYRMYTKEGFGGLSLQRPVGLHGTLALSGFIESIQVKKERNYFIDLFYPLNDLTAFDKKNFAGGTINYGYVDLNDLVVPTKGWGFSAEAGYTKNLTQKERAFQHYSGTFGFYVPFSRTFSLAVRTGANNVAGDPEFYQLAWLGGGQNLRGYHRQRFFGRSTFYDDNELRWLPEVKGHLFSGKIGLIAFLDNGRVWYPQQESIKWDFGYGGGFLIAPFNKVSLTVYYGVSEDDRLVHLRLGRFF